MSDSGRSPSGRAHTPLPWGISYGFHLGRFGQAPATYIAGPNPEQIGIKIATPWVDGSWDNDPEADANVAFIVRACNSHYELIEALEKCRDRFAEYAALHLAKGTREGILKAQANADMANIVCGTALAKASAITKGSRYE